MKVIVCGSRSWRQPSAVGKRLSELPAGTTIVHGQSPGGGVDLFADIYGRALGFKVVPVPICPEDRERAKSPRQAPIFRNIRMFFEHPDVELVLAFWDGASPGTRHMLDEARRRGVRSEVVLSEGGT